MKRVIWLATLAILAGTVTGCKSTKSVSRVYPSDMDTTWAVVLRVTEKVTGRKPLKADKQNGLVITEPLYGTTRHKYEGGYAPTRSTSIWQASITCESAASGTKVSIRIAEGSKGGDPANAAADDAIGGNTEQAYSASNSADIMIMVPVDKGGSSDTSAPTYGTDGRKFTLWSGEDLRGALFTQLSAELSGK